MIRILDRQPNEDGEPVFDAPWQAKTFAMAVKLHESGLFTWKEWADLLSRNISNFEKEQKIQSNSDYYRLWQDTLEELVSERVLP